MARGQIEKRGQRRRKLKPVILIVTEGSQTEPKYFEHYRSRQTNIDIRVVGSRTKGGETDYLGLIRKAVEYQSKNQISASNGDAVWVVADGDVNYNNPDPIAAKDNLLSRARKLADAKGIHIAISNPCFEFWYLLHFQYTTKFFKDYPAVMTALTAYLPDYEKAGDVYAQLSEHTTDAIQNAKRVEQYSFSAIGAFLLLQCLCFLGYTAFLNLLSYLLRHRIIVTIAAFFLLGVLYLYLTKISTALDMDYSLYKYWVVGLSHSLQINTFGENLMPILITLVVYLFLPTAVSFSLFQRLDLRGLERR